MRSLIKTSSLLIFLFIGLRAQTMHFENAWKFHPGDDLSYAAISCDESEWKPIQVTTHWETQGYTDLDGFAWYRLHFSVDKKMLGKTLYLFAGKIDDVDETYLNGVSVGKMGTFPPQAASEWNSQRVYKLLSGALKRENVLAIRVFDMGGPGGIYGGTFGLYGEKEYKAATGQSIKKGATCFQLPVTNGLLAAVYDANLGILTNVYPHIFQAIDLDKPVKPVISGIKLAGSAKPINSGYYHNTHILKVAYKKADLYYFASFTRPEKVFYCVLEYPVTQKEQQYLSMPGASENVLCDSLVFNIKNKLRKYYVLSFNNDLHNNTEIFNKAVIDCKTTPDLLETETDYMTSIFKKVNRPKGLSGKAKDLFEQSVAFLKMAQIGEKEIFPKAKGQIVASLPPGVWNICWVRDGSYAVKALVKLGLYEEAKNALLFFLNADAGYYKSFKHTDGKEYGIGSDYQISVCRYFGNGKEESDFNSDGPNVELDGFGLILSALSDYTTAIHDTSFFVSRVKDLKYKIAEPLLSNIDKNGLIRKESGSWERHLPGKQYAYTSITAAKGLQDFGNLLLKLHKDGGEKYLDAGKLLQEMIVKKLIDNSTLVRGTFEDIADSMHEYLDAASYEYFNFFDTDPKLFALHHDAYAKKLQIGKTRGFARVNNGDWYDKQEWIFLDLRISAALRKFHHPREADSLLKWVVNQSALNNNIISELYNEKTTAYEGAAPMVGFGAGSFILTLFGE